MCGIFGYFSTTDPTEPLELVPRMGPALAHRGPDSAGHYVGPGILLGNRRLSILDIAGGDQPFVSDDGAVVVVQNGEIYNYVELNAEIRSHGIEPRTTCDTETILHLYRLFGPSFVSKLNGMFAIAIYDAANRELLLFRDRLGVKPLYYTLHNGALYFASEIKSLLSAGVPASIDPQSLDLYLTFNYVPAPYTIYSQVRHVDPGAVLRAQRERLSTERWWSLADLAGRVEVRDDFSCAEEELKALFSDSIKIRMRADVPFGGFLSGGIDSAIVLATMSDSGISRPHGFTIGFSDSSFDERPAARVSARAASVELHEQLLTSRVLDLWPDALYFADQPHGDTSFLPTLALCRFARSAVTVALSGDGADELFAGYDRHRIIAEELTKGGTLCESYLRHSSIFNDQERDALYSPEFRRQLSSPRAETVISSAARGMDVLDPINQVLAVDAGVLLPGNNLVKPDRMGMAASLEVREPYLDYRLVEFAFAVPGRFKISDGRGKHLLRETFRGRLGDEVADRRKKMFSVPFGAWMKESAAAGGTDEHTHPLLEILRSRELDALSGFTLPTALASLWRGADRGEAKAIRQIRALVALELWLSGREKSINRAHPSTVSGWKAKLVHSAKSAV